MKGKKMIYFTNYYTAKKYAEKHGLKEREYGDTHYTYGGNPVSYVEYNKSGSRDDDAQAVCYYGWQKDIVRGRLIPIVRNRAGFKKEVEKAFYY